MVRLPAPRTRKIRAWTVAEACQFLDSARTESDPLNTAYVLMLILGLRLGEALGLPWDCINLDTGEVDIAWQLQRAGGQLHYRETKTPGSDAPLPLPAICVAAIKLQGEKQATWRIEAGPAWHDTGLLITTRYGTPYEPRNFTRHFAAAALPLRSGTFGRTACGAPAPHCWPRSTCIPGSPCASSGTARSP